MKKVAYIIVIMALYSQIAGMVFCGDIDCQQEGSSDNCAALICSLQAKHSPTVPSESRGDDDLCQCFCHWLIDVPTPSIFATQLFEEPHQPFDVLHFFFTPIQIIDHPPSA